MKKSTSNRRKNKMGSGHRKKLNLHQGLIVGTATSLLRPKINRDAHRIETFERRREGGIPFGRDN